MRRFVCLFAVLCACTGTEVGNPVDVDFTLYDEMFDPDAPPATAARANGLVTITDAWLAIERIRLRSAANCSGGAEREFQGPYFVDMLAPGPLPELAELDIPDTEYCRFEVRWSPFSSGLPAGTPPGLAGASILIAGTRGDDTPFVIRSDRNDELRLDAVGGAFGVVDGTNALLVGFSGPRLLAGVDLDAAVVSADNTIRIDKDNNEGLLQAFDDNLRAAADLFDDDDDDGELDLDERDEAADVLAQ